MTTETMLKRIQRYDGPRLNIMEVCGTHTAAIVHSGLRSLLPENIRLVSGPGCPVCVTEPGYIDALAEVSMRPNHCVFAFGDMLRVPGSNLSLNGAKAAGGRVHMFHAPHQVLAYAKEHPDETCVVAAIGFETTAPVYALMLMEAEKAGLTNIKLISALKTMIPPLHFLAGESGGIDAFLCPGHVSALIGYAAYEPLAEKYQKPFVVAGFEGTDILIALAEILDQLEAGKPKAANTYERAVTRDGNKLAMDAVMHYFEPSDASWRGIGLIPSSGLRLKPEHERFSAWPGEIPAGEKPAACRCGDVMLGRILPPECPLYGKACDPAHPVGPCMVSAEGACGIFLRG